MNGGRGKQKDSGRNFAEVKQMAVGQACYVMFGGQWWWSVCLQLKCVWERGWRYSSSHVSKVARDV